MTKAKTVGKPDLVHLNPFFRVGEENNEPTCAKIYIYIDGGGTVMARFLAEKEPIDITHVRLARKGTWHRSFESCSFPSPLDWAMLRKAGDELKK